jgi:hypothetical protein
VRPRWPFFFPRGKSVPRASVIHRCSLGLPELAAEEVFELGRCRAKVRVTAFPLHRGDEIAGPPTVCATFRPVR